MSKFKLFLLVILFFSAKASFAEILNKIIVNGNDRVPTETIVMFSNVKIGNNINNNELNKIIDRIYSSNFFENISTKFENNTLTITVKEYPIIGNIEFNGIKSKRLIEAVKSNLNLKTRSSLNEFLLEKDKTAITDTLKSNGYYFSKIEIFKQPQENNMVDIIYEIDLGNKAKIKKISFTGDKVFKDNKLSSVIISEEYKFWKFISGKKYLNEQIISIDNRLLKNFYLNNGYYNVQINSSFAKLIDDENFELIFNINANNKIFFNDLKLQVPTDFDLTNFKYIEELFENLKGKPYSINRIEKVLKKINDITTNEQFVSTKANVEENLIGNILDLNFVISETEKIFVEKINILGNNVTNEEVIRNQFELDEGDPFNEILLTRSLNNLKSLNFFKEIKNEIVFNETNNTNIINIEVSEKPTGEIMAGAGFGTSGGSAVFGVKENNYLGTGVTLDAQAEISTETFRGNLNIKDPNYKNSDKAVFINLEATETNRLSNFGYKTNKTGFSLGSNFEYYDDLFLGLAVNSYLEKIETDSTASARQKEQKGNYFDNHLSLSFDYDKRNQKFQTTEGFRNYYALDLPVISETNTLKNTLVFSSYYEYLSNTIIKSSFYFKNSTSITGDDVKLSERVYLPSSRLRGFERGKVGPKDGDDFIGGNFAVSVNFASNIPKILENSESTDFNVFLDIGNVWGVDYDNSLENSDDIKSSIGVGIDWFSPIGPMNFSLAQPLTKSSTDITESFRFNLGTTF